MATQADIDTLNDAINSGILSVKYQDKTVTYKSTQEQLMALAKMEAELSGDTTSGRSTFAGFQSG